MTARFESSRRSNDETATTGRNSQPHLGSEITQDRVEVLCTFAGLWERWDKGEEPVESCTLLTCEANGVVAPVHDRMPVILKPEDYARWLDPEEQRRTEALVRLLAPLPDDWLSAQPVGKLVNNPRNEDPRCIERRP